VQLKIFSTAFLLFFLATFSFAGPDMNEGKWQITTKTEIKGMPMQMPPQTYTQCIKKEDIVPETQTQNNMNDECKILNHEVNGDTVTWEIECKSNNGGVSTGKGTVTYNGDTMEGRVDINVSGGNMGDVKMIQHMNGKRIGDCK